MSRPELKQFGELGPDDFERHPVWIGCHNADYGKPWYRDTDDETFRPRTGPLPADPDEGILLVRSVIDLKDESRYPGFVTPATDAWDRGPNGQPLLKNNHILGTQQPHIFVGEQQFGFWGGMLGIPATTQKELYAALGRAPDAIFPLRFSADPKVVKGFASGQVEGFYRRAPDGIHISITEPDTTDRLRTTKFFQMSAKTWQGYPKPAGAHDFLLRYKKAVYSSVCIHCGIYDGQVAPFRFGKSDQKEFSGVMQFNWVPDAFFVRPDIAQQIVKSGITGISLGPAVDHRTGLELTDRVQILIPTIMACADISGLSTVTCRSGNEEALAVRALFAREEESPPQHPKAGKLSAELTQMFERERKKLATIPFCGRVKYHVPSSHALITDRLRNAPDLFQTAEWFGTGAAAWRLTVASERFVSLVRERGWKGLVFRPAEQSGLFETTSG